AATAGGMERVAFELANLISILVDVGQEAAGGLAVEAGGRHEPIVVFLAMSRPTVRIDFDDVVPSLRLGVTRETGTHRAVFVRRCLGNKPEVDGPTFDEAWCYGHGRSLFRLLLCVMCVET